LKRETWQLVGLLAAVQDGKIGFLAQPTTVHRASMGRCNGRKQKTGPAVFV
jgi:hypothetical protein